MSKLNELINSLCPNGVQFKKIEDVLLSIHSGLNPRQNFKLNTGGNLNYVTVKEITTGKIIFSNKTDKIDKDAWNKIQSRSCLEKGDVLLSGIGTIGKVAVVDIETDDWNCSESVLLLKPNKKLITSWYLKYILESKPIQDHFNGTAVGSTLKGIRIKDLEQLKIPVPPMEVQCEIVRILDSFTELTSELTSELTARRKQYEYYRDNLILNSGYPRVKLADIATDSFRGAGIKRDEVTEEGTPCIRYGEIYTSYGIFFDKCISHTDSSKIQSKKVLKKNDILFAITGESVEDIAKSTAYVGEEEGLVGGDIVVLRHNQNAKYLSYALSTADAVMQKGLGKVKSKVVHSNAPSILAIEIPLPSLEEQQRIVGILDNFDNLTMNMSTGIPSEIDGRTKQYEYYRDKLLEFKELKA